MIVRKLFATIAMAAALAAGATSASAQSSASTPAAASLFDKSGERWIEDGDAHACAKMPTLAWCKASPAAPSARSADEERALIAWAEGVSRKSWRTPDPRNNPEHWESFADEALQGKTWVGDCDNLTFTVMDLLARNGFPTDRMFRVIGPSSKAGVGHMVGVVKLADGELLIVGDSMKRAPYALPGRYKMTSVNQVSNGRIWYDVPGKRMVTASAGQD